MRKRNCFHVTLIFLLLGFVLLALKPDFSNLELKSYEKDVKSSAYWEISPFVINDAGGGDYTWSEAVLEIWCSGAGTKFDPYIIENISVNGDNASDCIEIYFSNVYFVIRDSIFYNSSIYSAGIMITSSTNGTLSNNICSNNNGNGISVDHSEQVIISENIIENNLFDGIELYSSDNITVSHNEISNNEQTGITSYRGENNTLTENIITDNLGYGIDFDSEQKCIIIGNTVNYNYDIGILLDISQNSLVRDNIVKNNGGSGIYLLHSTTPATRNRIVNNTIENNIESGIHLKSGASSLHHKTLDVLSENTIRSNGKYGIFLRKSLNTTIIGNEIKKNTLGGIFLSGCSRNEISGNKIVNNYQTGIIIQGSPPFSLPGFNVVSDNTVENHSFSGISLLSTFADRIKNNDLLNNLYGVYLNNTTDAEITSNQISVKTGGECIKEDENCSMTYIRNNICGNDLIPGIDLVLFIAGISLITVLLMMRKLRRS